MALEQAVWVDPARMSGVPCFRGTRLPVQQLFDWLSDGVPLEEFLRDFEIDPRAAAAVLRAAAAGVCAVRGEQSELRIPELIRPTTREGPSRCRDIAPPATTPANRA